MPKASPRSTVAGSSAKSGTNEFDSNGWQRRFACFLDSLKPEDGPFFSSYLRRAFRVASNVEQGQMLASMCDSSDPHVLLLALQFHQEYLGLEPLRPEDSLARVRARLHELPPAMASGERLQLLFEVIPPPFRGDLFRLASASCDPLAASLILSELQSDGPHAGLCARALLVEALDAESQTGRRRSYNALVLAAALASPASAFQPDLLIATIVQLCAPRRDDSSYGTLAGALEGASASVKRAFDRLIMSSSDRKVRERLIPMLSLPTIRRSARARLESCLPSVIDSACMHGGHRLLLGDRLALLGDSAFAMQFRNGLMNMVPYGERSSSVLFDCLLQDALREDDLIEVLALCVSSNSPILKWKGEVALRRLEPSADRDRILRQLRPAEFEDPSQGSRSRHAVDVLQQFASELSTRPPWWLGGRARVIMDEYPDAFQAFLRRSLARSEGRELLGVLQVIHRCRLGAAMEAGLLALSEPITERLSGLHRCVMIKILATMNSSRSAAYILRCTVDADARVQATAFSALALDESQELADIVLNTSLLERIARTAERTLRKAALKALRARSRASFDHLMEVLLGGASKVSPELFLDAAVCSGRPMIPGVLRLLEQTADEATTGTGIVALRMMRAQRGPCRRDHVRQVAS